MHCVYNIHVCTLSYMYAIFGISINMPTDMHFDGRLAVTVLHSICMVFAR